MVNYKNIKLYTLAFTALWPCMNVGTVQAEEELEYIKPGAKEEKSIPIENKNQNIKDDINKILNTYKKYAFNLKNASFATKMTFIKSKTKKHLLKHIPLNATKTIDGIRTADDLLKRFADKMDQGKISEQNIKRIYNSWKIKWRNKSQKISFRRPEEDSYECTIEIAPENWNNVKKYSYTIQGSHTAYDWNIESITLSITLQDDSSITMQDNCYDWGIKSSYTAPSSGTTYKYFVKGANDSYIESKARYLLGWMRSFVSKHK